MTALGGTPFTRAITCGFDDTANFIESMETFGNGGAARSIGRTNPIPCSVCLCPRSRQLSTLCGIALAREWPDSASPENLRDEMVGTDDSLLLVDVLRDLQHLLPSREQLHRYPVDPQERAAKLHPQLPAVTVATQAPTLRTHASNTQNGRAAAAHGDAGPG